MNSKIRVLVVDDSALIRKMLSDLLNQHPEIEVVGSAQDGSFVMRKIEQLKPDVVTLDVEMRNKGGLEVLPEIVTRRVPVIMVSAHTEQGAHATLKALELGAVDFVTKPQAGLGVNLDEIVEDLCHKIIAVGKSRSRTSQRTTVGSLKPAAPRPVVLRPVIPASCGKVDLIAVGASTGGPEALKELLVELPINLPGILIVQHMPAGFTKAFANRLDGLCAINVKEAEDGDPVSRGTALIAPGSHHMQLVHAAGGYRVRLLDTDPVNRHRPAVDVLFDSVAQLAGKRCIGIQMTGMGADGAHGLLNIYNTGAMTIAQDQDTCVVFGMPREAIKLGAATHILPLSHIAPFVAKSLGAQRPIKMAASV